MKYRTKKTICPECGETFLRSAGCDKPHLCKKYSPYHLIDLVRHIRAEAVLLHPKAMIPDQYNSWNIGYDLSSVEDFVVPPHGTANVSIGIALSVPLGFYYTIEARSSMAIKGIFPIGGIIDGTFTGNIFVMLINVTDEEYCGKLGDRVAQAIFHRGLLADITKVKKFSKEYNLRGQRSFGSSGR